ncbi:MAG: CcoQ/FixQ family Cbb3-type cytochrome c oxidase assembly chaperone [Steroidobacteraceae bacterium]|jgi:cytochrome c oxidase cbb3-type subunit 4|nr:CcoQ/FixQ family Cbb3-type cytochrome c oxidase assembly chaperone [Steroidobacteraceae bacterium]
MDIGTVRGLSTLLALVGFLVVAWWAYGKGQKASFDAASRMPLEDDLANREDK